MRSWALYLRWMVFAVLCAVAEVAYAQETDSTQQRPLPTDAAPLLPTPRDTASTPASTPATTSAPSPAAPSQESDLKAPVQFSARDSLVLLFDDAGDTGYLLGEAQAVYDQATLTAHRIDILFDINELRASGLPADTGVVGQPRFQEGSETSFSGERFAYNLETERGRVVLARTQIDDGFVTGRVVKVTEDSTLYILGGAYTTCDCGPYETPSYSLRSSKMKIVEQKWIYTGPIQLFIFNVPTPLWLPFGFLPAQEGRRSGPLPPSYGEDELGFYLRNWGWYWAINDYMDLQVRAGVWTKGSWQLAPLYRYNRRYRYSGQLRFDYVRNRLGERDDPDFTVRNDIRLGWSHNQTISPTARFNASVNLASTGYLRTVSQDYDDRVRQTIGSSVNFSKQWRASGRSLSLSLNHQQRLATGDVQLTLPNLSFSQGQRKPFERETRPPGGGERWYERITYSYTGTLRNQYDFTPLNPDTLLARGDTAAVDIDWYEGLFSPSAYRRATGDVAPFDARATHRVPISLNFTVSRLPLLGTPLRLNVSPSFNYTEDWFVRTERRSVNDAGRVETDEVSDFLALRQFSTGVSANTTFYGLFPISAGSFQGVRHTVRPTLSFTYRPDFFAPSWGYARSYVRDSVEVRYPIVPGVQQGRQQAVSFSVSNVFETRRVRTDSTGEERRRVVKLLDLNASSSYNFAADSLRLSNIRLTARTNLFGEVNVQSSATFSPYRLNAAGTRVTGRYVFTPFIHKPGDFAFARLTNFRVSASTSLRSRTRTSRRGETERPYERDQTFPGAGLGGVDPTAPGVDAFSPDDPYFDGSTLGATRYADFAIPWSLSFDVSYSISRRLRTLQRTATLNTSFDFNLTPNWKVRGRTGYDFERKEIVTTSLDILRDFECWQMGISWVPFGTFQSYSFDLHVKSGKLRDLLRLRQPRAGLRNRLGGAFSR